MNSEEFERIRKNVDDFGKCRNKNSNNLKEFERIRNVKLMEDHKCATNNQLLLLLLLLLLGIRYVTIWNNLRMSLTHDALRWWNIFNCTLLLVHVTKKHEISCDVVVEPCKHSSVVWTSKPMSSEYSERSEGSPSLDFY